MFCTHGNGPSEDRFCNYIKTFSPCLPSSLSESQRSVKAGNVADVWMDVDCSCVCWPLVSRVLEVEVGLSLHLGTLTNTFTFSLTVAVLLFRGGSICLNNPGSHVLTYRSCVRSCFVLKICTMLHTLQKYYKDTSLYIAFG